MSLFARLRDSDDNGYVKCCTCGKSMYWKEAQAGHFMSRSSLSTRYHPQNVNTQCVGCNMFKAGCQYEHGKYIDKVHGAGTAESLYALSKKIIKLEYDEVIETFKYLANQHAKRIGVTL